MIDGIKDMKLVIATPFYEMKGWSPYIKSLAATMWFLAKHTPIDVQFWSLNGDSYVERARNTIAHQFLESDRTHLMFIDSDMEWNLDGFTKLIASDVDVVGAGYPCKNVWDFYGCIIDTNEDETPKVDPKTGLISAWGVPTGFMKIRRQVFEKLIEAQPDNYYMIRNQGDKEPTKHYNFFGRIPPLGEDISFCRRWAEIGGKLWVQPEVMIVHYGVKGWAGHYGDFLRSCPGGSEDPARKVLIPA